MGIVGNFIGRTAEKVATKVATKVAIKVAEKVVYKVAIKSLYIFSNAIVALAPDKEIVDVDKAFVLAPPSFNAFVPIDKDRNHKKIYKETVIQLETLKKYANVTYKRLNQLCDLKLQLLSCFAQYVVNLEKITDLPKEIDVKSRYDVTVPSLEDFIKYIKETIQHFIGYDQLKLFIAAHGFVPFNDDDSYELKFIHPLEKEFKNIQIETLSEPKQLYSDIKSLKETYNYLNRYLEIYVDKLNTCFKRYTDLIKNFNAMIKKKNKYKTIEKFIRNSYLSTILIVDLINTDLIDDCKVNDKTLKEKMNRRMI